MNGAPEDFRFWSVKLQSQINCHLDRLMHAGHRAPHPLTDIGPSVTERLFLSFAESNRSNQSVVCLGPEAAKAQSPTSPFKWSLASSVAASSPVLDFCCNFSPWCLHEYQCDCVRRLQACTCTQRHYFQFTSKMKFGPWDSTNAFNI